MKSIFSLLYPIIILTAGCNSAKKQPESLNGISLANIEKSADSLAKSYQDLDIFSGIVLIAKNGETLYHKPFGMANREKNTANTLETKFDIGSINKLFTKVLILQLMQEGKIKPADNLGKFISGFPEQVAAKVTVSHLIAHSSGFGDYMQEPGFFERPKNEQTIKAIIELIKKMPLHFAPGAEQEYSNAGYLLLGGIAESVTGKSYYDNIKERIIDPLGLKNTVVDDTKAAAANRAIGYMKNMRGQLENNEGILMVPTPAGGFVSTAADLLTFFEAYFYSDKLVNEETKKQDEFYPMMEEARKNGRAIPVAGGFQGANSVVFNVLKDTVTIIVLANMDEPVAEQVGSGIYAIINGKAPKKATAPALQNVYKTFKEKGVAFIKANFEVLTENFHPGEPKDLILNNVGYNLLSAGETDDAMQIFKLNTELFPQIANTWDSYGEALLKAGSRKAALDAYEKGLAIKPDMQTALDAIRQIEAGK